MTLTFVDHASRPELAQLDRLAAMHDQLHRCADARELLARAAELARVEFRFDRGLSLSIQDGTLTAARTGPLNHAASDELRRQLLADHVHLRPNSEEAQLILRREGARAQVATARSVLAEELGLDHYALAVIAIESRAVALLALDRANEPVDDFARTVVSAFAIIVEASIEQVLLRVRLRQLATEVRHLTVSAQALMDEALEAPLPSEADGIRLPEFPLVDVLDQVRGHDQRDLLSRRESEVALLLAKGRSNREIAEQLVVSTETAKTHVASIMRKLDASNRAEAVARYLQCRNGDHPA